MISKTDFDELVKAGRIARVGEDGKIITLTDEASTVAVADDVSQDLTKIFGDIDIPGGDRNPYRQRIAGRPDRQAADDPTASGSPGTKTGSNRTRPPSSTSERQIQRVDGPRAAAGSSAPFRP
ncbi:MAG: hypothetical protein QM638_10365 [Nocardioides sp.]|uniref:hypothetical protein n=1 Tax=Nocardioides sp. TaxID=35761 RepID=UPI0039E6A5FB